MERSTIIGFILTLIIALIFCAGYIVFVASKNPTPARPAVSQTTPTTTTSIPNQSSIKPQTIPSRTPPLKVEGITFQPALSEPDVQIKMTRQIAGGGSAQPGSTLDITIILEKEGAKIIRALGIQELLPVGWTFDSVIEGTKPDLVPPPGRTPLLEFAWFNIPAFPTSFTYRVRVPNEFKDVVEIQGQTLYRADAGELRTDVMKSPVIPSGEKSLTPASSSDQSPSGKSEEMQPDAPSTIENASSSQPLKPVAVKKEEEEKMTLMQAITPEKYTPNSTLEVKATINFSGPKPVTALALVVNLPAQIQFEKIIDGPTPPIAPKKGDTGTLNFVWPSIPPFPFTITYQVTVQDRSADEKSIAGQVFYHTDGPQQQSERIITKISPESK
ncbi:MAG: hypothetical protein ACP5UA_05260 [Candidatus Hydrogenedens sp.]